MNTHARLATAVVGALTTATTLVVASSATSPAQSATLVPSRISVQTSDRTPASGQTFRLSGAVTAHGHRVPATVRVKTWRHGQWVQLPGAVVRTDRAKRYHVRIILQMKGQRQLRVVGDPRPAGIQTARRTITVTVH